MGAVMGAPANPFGLLRYISLSLHYRETPTKPKENCWMTYKLDDVLQRFSNT